MGAQTQVETFQEQEISNVVWAMATLSRSDEQLLETMARDVLRRGMAAFVPQAISNMVWGFAVLEYSNNPFMLVTPSPCSTSDDFILNCTVLHLP